VTGAATEGSHGAIARVCFAGAGTMGCANSLASAVSGYAVSLFDVSEDGLAAVDARHDEMGDFMVASGYCDADRLLAGRRRISMTTDLEDAAGDVDLVSESVFERLDVKRELHARLDRICPPRTILTTNTSALLVSDIEDAVERGDRFAALHTHLGSLLVDIVGGPRTSVQTIDALRRYVVSLNATPLVLKREHPGYVVNAMLGPLMSAALGLLVERNLEPAVVDRAWMDARGAPIGPVGLLDLFGLDLVLDSWNRRASAPAVDDASAGLTDRVLGVLRAHVDGGRLGAKSGAGFYDYPHPAFQDPASSSTASADTAIEVVDVLTDALVGAARRLVAADVVEPEQIDEAWIVATGMDEGPLAMGRRRDVQQKGAEGTGTDTSGDPWP
jgi:enoyl-CoA hydratase/3-hydroxyacyl-CoA dehydrogenase